MEEAISQLSFATATIPIPDYDPDFPTVDSYIIIKVCDFGHHFILKSYEQIQTSTFVADDILRTAFPGFVERIYVVNLFRLTTHLIPYYSNSNPGAVIKFIGGGTNLVEELGEYIPENHGGEGKPLQSETSGAVAIRVVTTGPEFNWLSVWTAADIRETLEIARGPPRDPIQTSSPRRHVPETRIHLSCEETPSRPSNKDSHEIARPKLTMLRRQQNNSSSPPSAKRSKLSNPIFQTPNPPKQSTIAPYTTNTFKKSSPYFSSAGGAKKRNSSILNFFKPIESANGVKGESSQKKQQETGDLFIRHGSYSLDSSDSEEEDDGLDNEREIGGWGRGRNISGESPLGASKGLEGKRLITFPAATNPIPSAAATGMQKSKLLPAPLDEVMSSQLNDRSKTPVRRPPVLKFDLSSIKLDASQSVLFSQPASSFPSSFKEPKQQHAASIANESEDEDEDLAVGDISHNRKIAGFVAVDNVKNKTVNKNRAFCKERTIEYIELSDDDLGVTKDRTKDKGKGIACDDFSEAEEFEEDRNFEMRDISCNPASHAAEGGFEDFAAELPIIMKPETSANSIQCPICSVDLAGASEALRNSHVSHCLDGSLTSLPSPSSPKPSATISPLSPDPTPDARPPATTKSTPQDERQQWLSSLNTENTSRSRPTDMRPCPYYKKIYNGIITVDAFCHGNITGCIAYFLTHFHGEHFAGLTSTWNHGPIYCSRVTANLVRTRLHVHPQYVRELPLETWVQIEGAEYVRVRGLDANHCPGSMLLLFEHAKSKDRVLHCGDFRANKKHIMHELLRPRPKGWEVGQPEQRIDTVYLDTTYLNPYFAFPSQEKVISACIDLCMRLHNETVGMNDEFEGRGRAEEVNTFMSQTGRERRSRGRILVVVGTHSIGKEKICIAIARALKTKIFAREQQMKICKCLEDEALNELLTEDPNQAQVHMSGLMATSAEMLQQYLNQNKPHFSRVVGFLTSGKHYNTPEHQKDPVSRTVDKVLFSPSWMSSYSTKDLVLTRGSNWETNHYEVPYSEHSSFRELTMFACALNIGKILPIVNIGSPKSRDSMKIWLHKWESEKKKRKEKFTVAAW
ncbi:DNA cross-link repair protein PSO2/SNM1 [Rhizina undulata]